MGAVKEASQRYPFNWAEYFQWLCDKVITPERGKYMLLLSSLHSITFVWMHPEDENRAAKGRNLRWEYAWSNERGVDDYILNQPCSVLEMLVQMAMDVEHFILGEPGKDQTAEWFWQMLHNVGLDVMDDSHYNIMYIQSKVDDVMYRRYDMNGNGGLFPHYAYNKDARITGLWQQANDYFAYSPRI